jgi:hypothetical protein
MSIEAVLKKTFNQTAVYWGNPVADHVGGFTFDAPVELTPPDNGVRWEEMIQVISDHKGSEITSRAVVYLLQDVKEEGVLFLGTLNDLYDLGLESSNGGIEDPKVFEHTFIIKRFDKVPGLGSTTDFLRKAYLTPSLSFGGF